MSKNVLAERFVQELSALLRETFEQAEGIYLDKGTSLFETLDTVSAQEASRPLSGRGATIAAHVDHARLYLSVLEASMRNEQVGTVDWEQIWRDTRAVTPQEWDVLKRRLRETYQRVITLMDGFDTWEGENRLDDALAMLAHNAYHLGAIRQILFVIR